MGLLVWLARIGPLLGRLWTWLKSTTWGKRIVFVFFTYMGGLIGRIFTFLGITLAVNEFATPHFTNLVAGYFLALPPHWIQMIGLVKIDSALTVILSAIAIAMANKVSIRRRRDAWQTPL